MTATMTTITIPAGDRPYCRIGLDLLDKALKQADKLFAVLGLPPAPIQHLTAASGGLRELLKGADSDEDLVVPDHLRRALRLGIAIEIDRVASLQDAQDDLLVPSGDTAERLRQLEGLLALLDDQLSVAFR